MNIQWYPGHMTKTRRQMEKDLPLVDAVCEIIDARIPVSSRNPDLDALCKGKPRLILMNRADLADPSVTAGWIRRYAAQGIRAEAADSRNKKGTAGVLPAMRDLLAEKIQRYAAKGQTGRSLKIMVAGIPNVGKSTLINQLAGRQSAKAENRPGVTRSKQWITLDRGILLMDTPGILWPKFESESVGEMLAFTGAVKDDVFDRETLACRLAELLKEHYPAALPERYHIEVPAEASGWELLRLCAKKRGFLLGRGELDTERMAQTLLEEFRAGKLGRFTLEQPEGESTECSLCSNLKQNGSEQAGPASAE